MCTSSECCEGVPKYVRFLLQQLQILQITAAHVIVRSSCGHFSCHLNIMAVVHNLAYYPLSFIGKTDIPNRPIQCICGE